MFQIFSTVALPCLITAPPLKPSVQLHLHIDNNNSIEKQPTYFLARKPPSRLFGRKPVKDTHTPDFSHIVVVGGSLLFHNETAGLQTPHTVTFLGVVFKKLGTKEPFWCTAIKRLFSNFECFPSWIIFPSSNFWLLHVSPLFLTLSIAPSNFCNLSPIRTSQNTQCCPDKNISKICWKCFC